MAYTIPLAEWLKHMDLEYLTGFVRNGGASIKFAVTPEESEASKAGLSGGMKALCDERDYALVEMNARDMRAHMPQDVFFHLARRLDWRLLARRAILRLAKERGLQVDGIDPTVGGVFEALADANGIDADFVIQEIRPGIQNSVSKNPVMARDFRVAMSQLCLLENTPNGGAYAGEPLQEWLTGENTRIGPVRLFSIYTAINRTTARYFIESALHWVRFTGYAGTVILFDNSRVTLARNPKDGLRHYTRAMTVDHYEMLREFIDGVDRLPSTLFVIVSGQEFLDEDSRSRGYGIYPALRTRVMDDVRDRNLINPIASLVRLA